MLGYIDIVRELNQAGVRYIVVGGVAVNMHGVPRMTYDLDLLVDLEDRNLEVLLGLLEGWGFRPRVPVHILDLADGSKRREWIEDKGMKAFNLVNEQWALSEIDIIIDSPVSYEQARANQVTVKVSGVEVPIASIPDLVLMKQNTGRNQDEADIRYLEQVQDESGR
jgi:predicted nucleotidyltransferase